MPAQSSETSAKRKAHYWANREMYRARSRAAYLRHREKRKAAVKKYAMENPEKVKALHAKNHAKNREIRMAAMRGYYRKNKGVMNASSQAYYRKNREKAAAWQKKYKIENREAYNASSRRYHALPHVKAKAKILVKNWGLRNPEKVRATFARRRYRKRNAIHPAHDTSMEVRHVKLAISLTKILGIRHEVDHIIPIVKGGFHHHENMQVMSKTINCSKHDDPFWERPGFKSWRDVPEFLWPESLRPEYLRRKLEIAA